MEITSPTASPLATATSSSGAASATSDFDTFLTLLTTQIRNQDPLEPADSTEYTAQLATFSNVEQAVQTNDLLTQMIARLDSQQVTGAADWIGMEIRHQGPVAHDGGSTALHTAIQATADRAELVVQDAAGREVARHAIDPDATTVGWPAAGNGASVANGQYSLHVEAWAGDLQLDPTPVSHYATIEEVVLGTGNTEMILGGGVRMSLAELQSIRRPAG